MGQRTYTFPKAEKLVGKKRIEELFKKGSSFYLSSLQVRHLAKADAIQHRLLISVPKKKFKRAVDRNLIKRRIREAYRIHKSILQIEGIPFLHLAFIYIAKDILDYKQIEQHVISVLQRVKEINKESDEKN